MNPKGFILPKILNRITEEEARESGYKSKEDFAVSWTNLLADDTRGGCPRPQKKENSLVRHFELERREQVQELRYIRMIQALEDRIRAMETEVRELRDLSQGFRVHPAEVVVES